LKLFQPIRADIGIGASMGVGKEEGTKTPWILKFSAKKGYCLSFEWEKTSFTTIDSLLEKF